MHHLRGKRTVVVFTILAGLALQGCPPMGPPPFNVTGVYEGTFVLDDPGQAAASSGPMSLELYHHPESQLIPNTFAGLVRIDWDTLLSPLAQSLLGITDDWLIVPVLANLQSDGSYQLEITLDGSGIPAPLTGDVDMQAATQGLEAAFQKFELAFAGSGTDTDADGAMDNTTGTLSILFEYLNAQQELIHIELSGAYQATFVRMPG